MNKQYIVIITDGNNVWQRNYARLGNARKAAVKQTDTHVYVANDYGNLRPVD